MVASLPSQQRRTLSEETGMMMLGLLDSVLRSLLSSVVDISEAMEENEASSTTLDNSDFAETEIPFDFPLPEKQFLSDADREKVRDYVLELSMNERVPARH